MSSDSININFHLKSVGVFDMNIDFYERDESDKRALISKYMLHTYNMGLTTTSGGNLSVRDESGRIFITPGGTDKGVMTPGDIVVVGADGRYEGDLRPSSELPFHKKIYESNSAFGAILHAHSPEISAFSAVRRIPVPLFAGSVLSEKKVLMAEYELTGSEALGEVIYRKFKESADIVVMENHGMISAAPTMREAFLQFEALEFSAKIQRLAGCISSKRDHDTGMVDPTTWEETTPTDDGIIFLGDDNNVNETEKRTLKSFILRAYKRGLICAADDCFSIRCRDGRILMAGAGYRAVHKAIYDTHPECNAVFIAHPPASTAFCVSKKRIDTRLIPESYMVLQDVGYFDVGQLKEGVKSIAKNIAADETLVMLENDGVIALGKTPAQAFDRLEVAEFSARTQIQSEMIAKPVVIPEEKIQELRECFNIR